MDKEKEKLHLEILQTNGWKQHETKEIYKAYKEKRYITFKLKTIILMANFTTEIIEAMTQ